MKDFLRDAFTNELQLPVRSLPDMYGTARKRITVPTQGYEQKKYLLLGPEEFARLGSYDTCY